MAFKVNKRRWFTILSAIFLIGGTWLAIQYAQGKIRFGTSGIVQGTGLLSATSDPRSAQIYINDRLIGATDETIYLEPDSYEVRIEREGFHGWKKTMHIEPELVTSADARLFPIATSLDPLTFTGTERLTPSPDGQKLAFYVASQSAELKNGWYVLDLSGSLPFTNNRTPRQILVDNPVFLTDQADLIWSPDSTEIMFITPRKEVVIPVNATSRMETLPNTATQRRQTLSLWEEEMYLRERQYLAEFPDEVIHIATTSAKNVYFSPDKKMLLYTATTAATLSEGLVPPLPAASTQTQARQLVPNTIYVYDREEDRNFALGEDSKPDAPSKFLLATDLDSAQAKTLQASPSAFLRLQTATTSAELAATFHRYHSPLYTNTYQWFPDSRHLMDAINGAIQIKEYDNTNQIVLYSGPFNNEFFYPWPDGSKIMVTATFNVSSPLNLYAIDLR